MVDFHGPNAGYILELYERFRQSPDSVDEETRRFFQNWTPLSDNGRVISAEIPSTEPAHVAGAVSYAQAIRQFGHLDAKLDPLGSEPPGDPELSPQAHGITIDDLKRLPASVIDSPAAARAANAHEVIEALRKVYCSSIGFDNDHIHQSDERQWLREAAESRRYQFEQDPQIAVRLLDRLTQVEAFEHFLQRSFPTKYRFSIEGLDMMVPILDEIIANSVDVGMTNIAIAMAHRGRLNVLAHIMNKPYQEILADFKDPLMLQEMRDAIGWTVGDVKYHKGVERKFDQQTTTTALTVTMPPNPSHLEAINPVAVGMARAAGTKVNHPGEPYFNPDLTMQILIHGDAAFPGQGSVAETFNLSRLPGYWTGGTIHIIVNNQIGFTTHPEDGRSTLYASDLAKGFKVPIIHVNADDPEACIEVARLAFAYQDLFERDILIDLIGYRRYGHNELDEPSFTQPIMYKTIRKHPTVRQLWSSQLESAGILQSKQTEDILQKHNQKLQEAHDTEQSTLGEPPPLAPPPGAAEHIDTSVSAERLNAINDALETSIEGFKFYSRRLENTIRARRAALRNTKTPNIDWATAEELAFATLLEDGIPIRITGQDCERGTFSHRHAVLRHSDTGDAFTPLQNLIQATAAFEIHNSPLSEVAALGFEYGYNVQAPERLVIWEAQYGDFTNNAQTIVDEFILSAREKWGQTPSLVMLLPHGHEGAGPDHSSARPERYLQLAAKINVRIAYPTSAAQYFHLLRRQALLLQTDPLPLVIMSPKSLLRNPDVASSLTDLSENHWQPVIADLDVEQAAVDRLVFCSGKFYLDLIGSEHREQHPNVAVVRVEQLYPFPVAKLRQVIQYYPSIQQIVWAQEEPKNMGAWEFMGYRLKKLVGMGTPVNYVGRRRSSSPAEGSSTAHKVNQSMITEYAFNWKFDQE